MQMVSLVHLKIKDHNDLRKPDFILDDLQGSYIIHESILKKFIATINASKQRKKKIRQVVSMIQPQRTKRKNTAKNDKLVPTTEVKVRTLRLISNRNLVTIQLGDNLV